MHPHRKTQQAKGGFCESILKFIFSIKKGKAGAPAFPFFTFRSIRVLSEINMLSTGSIFPDQPSAAFREIFNPCGIAGVVNIPGKIDHSIEQF